VAVDEMWVMEDMGLGILDFGLWIGD